MDTELAERWREYRVAVEEVYREEDGRLVFDGNAEASLLAGIVERSEGLNVLLARQLSDDPREADAGNDRERREHEIAAFALAGIDLAVGAALLLDSREEAEARADLGDLSSPPVPRIEELPPMNVLLWKASQAFGEAAAGAGAGAEPGPPWIIDAAASAIDRIVEKGADPATDFGKGMLSLGIGGLVGAAGGFDPLHRLVEKAWGKLHVGVRLLRSALKKLAQTVGSEDFLGWIYEQTIERFGLDSPSIGLASTSVFRRLVGADSSLGAVTQIVERGNHREDLSTLQADLEDLYLDFGAKMWWASLAAKLICVGGFVAAILSLGVGHLAVAAAYGIGFAVCLFATADFLDTVPKGLGWVAGVPSLVTAPPVT